MKRFLIALFFTINLAFAEINMYGPGGPHTALQDIAKEFQKDTGIKVNVNFGPQKTWQDKAKNDADILFGASDQSALAIANSFEGVFDIHAIKPLYFREAIILTQKGNPLDIKGLKDLALKQVRIVVPDGAGVSNTSGTGVWEDMIGRAQDVELIEKLRKNIVLFTPNSGSAKKAFLDNEADVWITWLDWAKSNPDFGEVVNIEKDLVVYRTFNVVSRNNSSKEVQDFINYLSNTKSQNIFKKYGWKR